MQRFTAVQKLVLLLILVYLFVWFTDSIWEYMPDLTPSRPTGVVTTPSPSSTPECQTYWNAAGEAESSCEPVDLDNPGWEGR